jgi:site-specific DNA recombinase
MNSTTSLSFAVSVLRVSTEDQVEGTSLAEQGAACRALATREGFELCATFSDDGVSGKLFSARPGLQSAIERLAQLRAEHPEARLALIFARLDRAVRRVGILEDIRAALRPIKAEILYCDVTIDASPTGEFVETLLGGVSQLAVASFLHLTAGAKRARAKDEGIQVARSARPFGYDLPTRKDVYPGSRWTSDDIGRYFVREEEARHVREIFTLYAAGDISLRSGCKLLNDRGVLTGQGGLWTVATLRGVLLNPVYKGEASYGRREHWREERGKRVVSRSAPREPGQVVTIPCPAIVSESVWRQCSSRMENNQSALGGNPRRKYLLSGLLRCPKCGARLFGRTCARDGLRYRCCGYKQCGANLRGIEMETVLLDALQELVTDPSIVRRSVESLSKMQKAAPPRFDGQAIRTEIQRLSRMAERAALREIEAEDPAPYQAAIQSLSGQIAELRARLEGEGETAAPVKASEIRPSAIIERLGNASRILSCADVDAALRNRTLHALLESVTPIPDGEYDLPSGKPGRRIKRWGVEMRLHPAIAFAEKPDTVVGVLIRATVSGVTLEWETALEPET